MLQTTPATGASLEAYADIFGAAAVDRIRKAARPLQGASVLHVSTSLSGTHHARMLQAAVPLLINLGLDAHWLVARSSERQGRFADALYDAIEGEGTAWSPELADTWRDFALDYAKAVDRHFDLVVVHDPQLLMLRHLAKRQSSVRWIWHCHLDMRDCDQGVMRVIADAIAGYDLVAVEHPGFAGDGMQAHTVIPPAIDPLSGRNVQLPPQITAKAFRRFDLNPEWPLVLQVSRFDGWDDPIWAIYTYEAARKFVPNLQLVLAATSTTAEEGFARVSERARNGRVRLLSSDLLEDFDVNALQGAAVVAMQQGVRKGFSPALLEASWKGRPVLAGEGGALADQVVDGETGYIFKTFDEAAQRIAELIEDRNLADALGFEGYRLVRENHLVMRWAEAYLNLLAPVGPGVA